MTATSTQIANGFEYLERPGRGGPGLLLLHGIGSNGAAFKPVLEHLPGDWRVLAWNAPGYGKSDPLPDAWPQAADYANALEVLLDTLDTGPLLVAGHSLGALIATAYTARFPRRVDALLLASPALGHGMARGGELGAAAQSRIDDLENLGPEAFAAARAAKLVHDPENHPGVVAAVQATMAQVRNPGYAQAVRMLASGHLTADAALITRPVDVLVGAQDDVTPPAAARKAHAAVPSALRGSYSELQGAGHAIYQQCPAEFAEALIGLWERHAKTANVKENQNG